MNHSRLEQYLDELERPLTALGETARSEWREEARQHLADLAAAHEELGASSDEAVVAALKQFGDAAQIGRAVQRESVYFWQRAGFQRALLLLAGGYGGGLLFVRLTDKAVGPLNPLNGQINQTLSIYAVAGVIASLFVVAGQRRTAWMLGGACVAAFAGPSIKHLADLAMCRVLGAPYYQTDPIQAFCYAVVVGAVIWGWRVDSVRAARATGLVYLATLAPLMAVTLGRQWGTPDGLTLASLRVPLVLIAFWAVQGALLGGFLGVTRRALGQVVAGVRRRFERVGSFAGFTTR